MEDFTDTRPGDMVPENIHQILGHVRRIAQTSCGQTITFTESYDPSLPDVLAVRDRLVQAFLNLLTNAVQASPEGGTVAITTAYRQGVRVRSGPGGHRTSLPLEVCVIDEGAGPPAHILDHLFEPFVTARPGGSGLGLALVAKVIAEHGGVVEHDRREGRTIFRVLLPLAPGGAGRSSA
jgi:two-component system nitrogen regulation sensor histidine kinase GlnL